MRQSLSRILHWVRDSGWLGRASTQGEMPVGIPYPQGLCPASPLSGMLFPYISWLILFCHSDLCSKATPPRSLPYSLKYSPPTLSHNLILFAPQHSSRLKMMLCDCLPACHLHSSAEGRSVRARPLSSRFIAFSPEQRTPPRM